MRVVTTLLNLSGATRLPIVRQAEAAECGLACLAMIAGWHGYDTDLASLRRRFPISMKGMTLKTLVEISGKIGLGARALRCDLEELPKLRTPCVLHWEFKHFVVLRKVSGDRVWLHDPAIGIRICQLEEISSCFTGVALELTPTPGFEKKRERDPVKLSSLWRWTPDTRSALFRGFLLSLLLEIFVLLNPFYMQLVIDEAILKSDENLMIGLATAFAMLCIFNSAAGGLRGLVFQYLANILSFDMEARLFHHLIRLPLDYFQKRSLGDLLQRFHALEPIKQFIINGGISAIIDGSLALFTGALMVIYSPKLGAIAIGVFALYLLIRLGALSLARRYAADAIVTDAREQTKFLETIRAIQTIKVSGGETNREVIWRNLYAAKINSTIKSGNLAIVYLNTNSLLSGLSDVGLVYLAARDAMAGSMTVGVITAFIAYKTQFMSRMSSLVDQAIQFKMLDVQLDRVGDIALTEQEVHADGLPVTDDTIAGRIEAVGLSFSYAPDEPRIVKDLVLAIEPGEFVAIIGPSGAGKSTLLKLLVGLYEPSEGEVLIDGRTIRILGAAALRRQLGVVMQEDQLLAGTIAENIALFDDRIDMTRVRDCSQLAAIDADIMGFPMQYNSLVGDMGATLSSGQKQRVMIARALYRDPKILVMDEGTAHLDHARETQIHSVLKQLPITRIVVAHGIAMMKAADRVLELRNGVLREVRIGQLEMNAIEE